MGAFPRGVPRLSDQPSDAENHVKWNIKLC